MASGKRLNCSLPMFETNSLAKKNFTPAATAASMMSL
jgi:hypothetical protein